MAYELFRIAVLFDGTLTNIDCLVADPFEVRHEPKGRREKTKIVGHWLSQRKNAQDERMRLELVAIDLDVEGLDLSPNLWGSATEAFECEADGPLTPSAHC
jgi:hypothetical protein